MFRNWQAICGLLDPNLKNLAATTTDPDILRGLARGFPELFQEEKPESDGPWPLSVLRRAVETNPDPSRDLSCAEAILEQAFGFPCVHAEGRLGTEFENPLRLTREEAEAVVDAFGITDPRMFPVYTERVTVNGVEYYIGFTDPCGSGKDAVEHLNVVLYPCSLVDENA